MNKFELNMSDGEPIPEALHSVKSVSFHELLATPENFLKIVPTVPTNTPKFCVEQNTIKKRRKHHKHKCSYTNDIKPGDKFGRLTVDYYDNKKYQWFCKCDCGGSSYVMSNRLINGVHSCKLCRRITYKKVVEGETFNNLTTVSYDKEKSLWLCKCKCGNIKYVRSNQLAKGRVKSCGCLFRGPRVNKRRIDNNTLKLTLFKVYQKAAKNKHKNFSLTENEFVKLITSDCYYCGSSPKNTNKKFRTYDKKFRYNGIDRIDNTKGYEIDNCVSCCVICNKAKSTLHIDEFKDWIKRIYNKQFGKEDPNLGAFFTT